jgi:hypothetical protein
MGRKMSRVQIMEYTGVLYGECFYSSSRTAYAGWNAKSHGAAARGRGSFGR